MDTNESSAAPPSAERPVRDPSQGSPLWPSGRSPEVVLPNVAERPPFSRLTIDPSQNVLVGLKTICEYLRIGSPHTFYKYWELHGLPAVKRHDGKWLTTMTLLDEWIWLGAEAARTVQPFTRSNSDAAETALRYAVARIERMRQLRNTTDELDIEKYVASGPGRSEPREAE